MALLFDALRVTRLLPLRLPSSSVLSGSDYLPAFTGVRAVAAWLVFLHHFNPFAENGPERVFNNVVREFHIGVTLFFVLSGFLITRRYANSFAARWSWRSYMRNRLARIYPLYLLLAVFTCAVLAYRGELPASSLLPILLLGQGLFSDFKFAGIAQAWSLTVEESFYLVVPAAFWLLRQRVPLWVQPFGWLALGSLLVFVCTTLAPSFHGLFGSLKFMLIYTFFGRSFEFYAGIQLALWARRGQLPRYVIPGFLTVTGLAVIVGALAGMVWTRGGYTYGLEHPFGVALNNVMLPGGILLLFAGLLTEPTWLRRVLSSAPAQLLGKSSYAFYLIHLGVIHDWLAANVTSHLSYLFLLLNLLAVGLYAGIEKPLNRWVRQQTDPVCPSVQPT